MLYRPSLSRRSFLASTSSAVLAVPFMGLYSRSAEAGGRVAPIPSPYGPVRPVADRSTGLELLMLPDGFSYQSFGWAGDLMSNGRPTPMEHDGMGVVRSRVVNGQAEITLIRNHESRVLPEVGIIGADAIYDGAYVPDKHGVGKLSGGATKLIYRGGEWIETAPALGGTINNCAGGPTGWNTWLSCEEHMADFTDDGGRTHGYVFEVSDIDGATTGNAITAMGRMDHEAVALDPRSGALYLTEDNRNLAGLYKFEPDNTDRRIGALEQGGTLYMAKVKGVENADLIVPRIGESHAIEWIKIDEPNHYPDDFEETDFTSTNFASGPFIEGWGKGALRFSRLEGCWYSHRDALIYVVDTSAGLHHEDGRPGQGDGAVWTLDPKTDTLFCVFASEDPIAGNNPDNITISPRGGVLMCEDGGGVDDGFGPGERLMGLSPAGETYIFAKNNVVLSNTDIKSAGKSSAFIKEGDYREDEWAGATFDHSGRVLFVNAQTPGITFAITGPWERGFL